MAVQLEKAVGLMHGRRRVVTLAVYGALAAVAYSLAYLLRFEFSVPPEYGRGFLVSLAFLVAIRILLAYAFRLSSGRWRFVGTSDVLRLTAATAVGTVVFYIVSRVLPFEPVVPRSVVLIEFFLTTYVAAGVWIAYRTAFERMRHLRSSNGHSVRVLIVGAGEAANLLAREMLRIPTGYRPLGFIDDDRSKHGSQMQGLQVFGALDILPSVAERLNAQEVIIAIPSASPKRLREIVARCEATRLPFKVLPGIAEVLDGKVWLAQLRDLQIEDLLGREPIRLELPELDEDLRDCTVLITGAAGSIGSELARQVALHRPARLVLLDQAETELFYVEMELRSRYPDLHVAAVVGDIVDHAGMEQVFLRHLPSRVFHAAAYKHVPLMELNMREAVRNNVLGTWRLADLAGRYGAGKFILVSTDKAVRPSSMMGATKRLAELVVLEAQQRHKQTMYGAVRFGNVLGSRGSVIPVFRRQLRDGRPLTITHPDVTRYFMTIAEAVQLILQASLIPELRGRIAMFDMGEPVRIVDLARNLLRLSGRGYVDGESIVFTGLRPGEKLHEELAAPDEDTVPTEVAKVSIIVGPGAANAITPQLPAWEAALNGGGDAQVFSAICALFAGLCAPDMAEQIPELPAALSTQSA